MPRLLKQIKRTLYSITNNGRTGKWTKSARVCFFVNGIVRRVNPRVCPGKRCFVVAADSRRIYGTIAVVRDTVIAAVKIGCNRHNGIGTSRNARGQTAGSRRSSWRITRTMSSQIVIVKRIRCWWRGAIGIKKNAGAAIGIAFSLGNRTNLRSHTKFGICTIHVVARCIERLPPQNVHCRIRSARGFNARVNTCACVRKRGSSRRRAVISGNGSDSRAKSGVVIGRFVAM